MANVFISPDVMYRKNCLEGVCFADREWCNKLSIWVSTIFGDCAKRWDWSYTSLFVWITVLFLFLFYSAIFSSQIESLQYGPIQRGLLCPYAKRSRHFPFYHRCGRYFMYARITLYCIILGRMGIKTGYAEYALNSGHTCGVYNRQYCNCTGYQHLYIRYVEKWKTTSTHTNSDTFDESSLLM
jgi:hypothetical protein